MSWTASRASFHPYPPISPIETEEKANLVLILCNALELFDPASWCSPAHVVIVILSPLSGAAALLSLSTAAWPLLAACYCAGAENQAPHPRLTENMTV